MASEGKKRKSSRYRDIAAKLQRDIRLGRKRVDRGIFDLMRCLARLAHHHRDLVEHLGRSLRAEGVDDRDVLLAGLLHDAGKGDTGVGPRVAYSLGQRYGTWIWRSASVMPGWADALARLKTHAHASATLAAAAGCFQRTVDLIREQDAPTDPEYGELFRLADEAN